jgi:hypothetical protein
MLFRMYFIAVYLGDVSHAAAKAVKGLPGDSGSALGNEARDQPAGSASCSRQEAVPVLRRANEACILSKTRAIASPNAVGNR